MVATVNRWYAWQGKTSSARYDKIFDNTSFLCRLESTRSNLRLERAFNDC